MSRRFCQPREVLVSGLDVAFTLKANLLQSEGKVHHAQIHTLTFTIVKIMDKDEGFYFTSGDF